MIEVSGLTKNYEGHWAVRGVSFDVAEGDIFGFIGPNGAGKTTSIRIISTLLEPTTGTVKVGGRNVIGDAEAVRRLIGFMPDNFGVYERITVWEYLDFFAAAYGIDRRRRAAAIDGIMELTDLKGLRDRLTGELSKGMRQRLCLAKTLVHDPKVLILDEPANGLDPRARIEFRALLKELRSMGKTILISSHILTELSDICTSVAILEKGKVVTSGSLDSIKKALQPGLAFRLEVLNGIDAARGILEALPDVSGVKIDGDALRFQFGAAREQIPDLVRALVARNVAITGLQEEKTDLEGLFMRLTKGEVS
ncbi:MAG: ABC transporter ATP-binding protein [Planctomycetaceae bacterium]|nr:ABC transporter ATP-binding protein [Planctomycetaceae bacterium]